MDNNVLHIHIKGFCIFTCKMSIITLQITAASSGWWLYSTFTQKRLSTLIITLLFTFLSQELTFFTKKEILQ